MLCRYDIASLDELQRGEDGDGLRESKRCVRAHAHAHAHALAHALAFRDAAQARARHVTHMAARQCTLGSAGRWRVAGGGPAVSFHELLSPWQGFKSGWHAARRSVEQLQVFELAPHRTVFTAKELRAFIPCTCFHQLRRGAHQEGDGRRHPLGEDCRGRLLAGGAGVVVVVAVVRCSNAGVGCAAWHGSALPGFAYSPT